MERTNLSTPELTQIALGVKDLILTNKQVISVHISNCFVTERPEINFIMASGYNEDSVDFIYDALPQIKNRHQISISAGNSQLTSKTFLYGVYVPFNFGYSISCLIANSLTKDLF